MPVWTAGISAERRASADLTAATRDPFSGEDEENHHTQSSSGPLSTISEQRCDLSPMAVAANNPLHGSTPFSATPDHGSGNASPTSGENESEENFWTRSRLFYLNASSLILVCLLAVLVLVMALRNDYDEPVCRAKPIESRLELLQAVDTYLAGNLLVVEAAYGNISRWNVSQISDFSTAIQR